MPYLADFVLCQFLSPVLLESPSCISVQEVVQEKETPISCRLCLLAPILQKAICVMDAGKVDKGVIKTELKPMVFLFLFLANIIQEGEAYKFFIRVGSNQGF